MCSRLRANACRSSDSGMKTAHWYQPRVNEAHRCCRVQTSRLGSSPSNERQRCDVRAEGFVIVCSCCPLQAQHGPSFSSINARVARPLLRPSTRLKPAASRRRSPSSTPHTRETRVRCKIGSQTDQRTPSMLARKLKQQMSQRMTSLNSTPPLHVVSTTLGDRRGDCSIIMSGGTEGVLTPPAASPCRRWCHILRA